ncbi:MAG: IS6 family transposase [Cyanobacteria bacterium P01_D01_bin.115]
MSCSSGQAPWHCQHRGITVTYEAIREWGLKFAQGYANWTRKQRPKLGNQWHLDEVAIKIKGEEFYFWRTVDQHGVVLDSLMQLRRNQAIAKKFFYKLLKPTGFAPRVIIIDKLKSYGAVKKDILKSVEHRQHRGLNNRVENSHRPTRVREWRMSRFNVLGPSPTLSTSL